MQADASEYNTGAPLRALERTAFPDELNNDRTRLKIQDLVNNILFRPSLCTPSPVPDVASPSDPDSSPLSISDLCASSNMTFGSADKIGRRVAESYRTRYGPHTAIQTHTQLVNGRNCQVNHYTHKDH